MTTPPRRPPGTQRAGLTHLPGEVHLHSLGSLFILVLGHGLMSRRTTSMSKSAAVSLTGRSPLSTSAGARTLSQTFILACDSHSSTLTPGSPVHYLSAAYRYRRLANSAVRMSTTTHPGWSVTGEASAPPRAMPPAAAEHPASPGTPGPRSPSSGSDESGVPARGRRRIR